MRMDANAPAAPPAPPSGLTVACLCAGWCTTCQAYTETFAEIAARHPDVRCVWIDIESHSDALGDEALDIENFPTVMVLRTSMGSAPAVLFHGTILPHAQTLDRLVKAAVEGGLGLAAAPADLVAGVVRLAGGLAPV